MSAFSLALKAAIAPALSFQILPISLSIALSSLSLAPTRFLWRVIALAASSTSNPSMMLASNKFAAIYSRFALVLYGSSGSFANRFGTGVSAGCSAAAADDVVALSFDLDRAGWSVEPVAGVAEELRPLVVLAVLLGAGATTTASDSGGLDPALSSFSAFPTDVVGARFVMGPAPTLGFGVGMGVGPDVAPDELDAAPGVRDALLLLALALAVGGCAEGSLLLGIGFAAAALAAAAAAATSRFGTEAALGTEAARGGATLSWLAAGSSFGAKFSFAFS